MEHALGSGTSTDAETSNLIAEVSMASHSTLARLDCEISSSSFAAGQARQVMASWQVQLFETRASQAYDLSPERGAGNAIVFVSNLRADSPRNRSVILL